MLAKHNGMPTSVRARDTDSGREVYFADEMDVYIARLRDALRPFAARVHRDGVDAPYPEDKWRPALQAAYDALHA